MSYHTNVDWDKFLKNFPNAHLLQTRPWGEVKAAFGWEATWVATEAAGAQLLFQPLPFGFTWGYIARGPVGYPDEDFWQLIEAECRRHRAVFLKIEPDLAEIGETPESHWPPNDRFRISHHSIQPRRTLSVNLDGEEEDILERMKQKTRYNIRLSDRKGVKVRHSDDITGFYKLLQVTGQRDEFGIHTEVYYQTVFNAFTSTDSCALILAEFEDSLLSAAMVFAQGERSWYLYGASSNQHRNIMAPYAVQWEAIRWARSKGCRQYDLWGVPDKDIEHLETEFMNRSDGLWGVYRFKRGFGGTLKRTVGSWDIVFNPVLYSFYLQWVKKHAT